MKYVKVALCEKRHPQLPADYVFPHECIFDLEQLEQIGSAWIEDVCTQPTTIDLYMTGFTPAFTSFVKACNEYVTLNCWHFSKADNKYIPQYKVLKGVQ